MSENGFLGLDMKLVRDIFYLLEEEMGGNNGMETKAYIWILKRKGYGRDKVIHCLWVMEEAGILTRNQGKMHGKRFWYWRPSAMLSYARDFFKVCKSWGEEAPLFNDIRKEYESLKSQGFTEREK